MYNRKILKLIVWILAIVLIAALLVIGGYWLLRLRFDTDLLDRSGWKVTETGTQYLDYHGDPLTGWQTIDENRFYFTSNGFMSTGWQDIDGSRFYFTPQGIMSTGWQDIDGSRYYFSGDGTMDTGFWEIEGKRYFFADDGVMQTGWLDLNGSRYYLDKDGVMLTSWQDIGENRYHFRDNGILDTGLTLLDGEQYRFLEDGALYTGWDVLEGELVYYLPEGPRAIQWQQIDGKYYYFGYDGVMQTGWISLGENRYYLREDGAAAVGPTVIDGETYYFSPKGIHVVLVNESHPVPKYYETRLVTITAWHQVSDVCANSLSKMLAACMDAGIEYTFNSAYRTIAQQQEILDYRVQEYVDDGMPWQLAYAKARETVALPGTSEHHLGLAVDLLGDEAIAWLNEHCWEYGFIVRYREDKKHITGIIDEPWHFRYVGKDVAMEMKDLDLCLEEYLGAVEPEKTQ